MKIVVVGLGYVGLSNAVLLAQHNEVIGVDISKERVDALNMRKSPIFDMELSEYLAKKDLKLSATTNLKLRLRVRIMSSCRRPPIMLKKQAFLIRHRLRQ